MGVGGFGSTFLFFTGVFFFVVAVKQSPPLLIPCSPHRFPEACFTASFTDFGRDSVWSLVGDIPKPSHDLRIPFVDAVGDGFEEDLRFDVKELAC
jgi:hypothetical protein